MRKSSMRGVAFILEGITERVFYKQLLQYYVGLHPEVTLSESYDAAYNVETYILSVDGLEKTIVRFHVIGTISQMSRAHLWFQKACKKAMPEIPWTVVLCYDTDDSDAKVSPFREGDWPQLSDYMTESNATVIDMAARADIEDIMLTDYLSVAKFLGVSADDGIPPAKKGKRKIRLLYARYGKTYHEGERAGSLIAALNFEVITRSGVVPFEQLEHVLFWFKD